MTRNFHFELSQTISEMVRALLTRQPLSRDFVPQWKLTGENLSRPPQ